MKHNSLQIRPFFVLYVLLYLLVGCSFRAPQSFEESSNKRSTRTCAVNKTSQDLRAEKQNIIRIDYLRPISAIGNPIIYVCKGKRRLYVFDQGVLVRSYPIGLGKHPIGDKKKRGDGHTPEGNFYVCVKNPKGHYGKALGLSYPDLRRARRALLANLISPAEYQDISSALSAGLCPPWDTILGGEIFIHGGGAQTDWTNGCIALYDSDMDELYRIAKIGTPVIVRP